MKRPTEMSSEHQPLSETTVSVVIPAYKAAGTICRAIDSVLVQSVPVHEIIVVDDGSPDHLAEVVERHYGDRVVLIRKPNGGAASARNLGIERSTGEIIAFLDADDYWEPNKVELQVGLFQEHAELGLIAGRYFQEQPGGARFASRMDCEEWYDRLLTPRGALAFRLATLSWTGTVAIRRSALGSERFVSGLEPAEDRDLWVRLICAHGVYLASQPVATAVLEPNSLSRANYDRDCSNMLRVIDRHRRLLGRFSARQWKAITYFRRSTVECDPRASLAWMLKSVFLWPFPMTALPDRGWLMGLRLKRLAVCGRRWIHGAASHSDQGPGVPGLEA